MTHLVGIDEAGRGPLAGPVAVGVVVVPKDFDWALVVGATDSKQMTEKARERMYETLVSLQQDGLLRFAVGFSSARVIDTIGIVPAIQRALNDALREVTEGTAETPTDFASYEVLLDGGLTAPKEFTNQKTIIRGDQSEQVISLASIAAKVLRDKLMVELAVLYPQYSLEKHKGYGTLVHRRAIQEQGLSDIHRATFCTRLHIGSNAI